MNMIESVGGWRGNVATFGDRTHHQHDALHDDSESLDHTLPRGRTVVRRCVGTSACIAAPTKQLLLRTSITSRPAGNNSDKQLCIADHLAQNERQTENQAPSIDPSRGRARNWSIKGGKLEGTRRHRRQSRCTCLMNENSQTTCYWAKRQRTQLFLSLFLAWVQFPRAPTAETHLGAAMRAAAINCMTFIFADVWGRG